MTDYTGAEIEEAVQAKYDANDLDENEDEYFEGWPELGSTYSRVHEFLNLRGEEIKVEHVENNWNSDGDAWVVIKVGNQLFRRDGWHSSYEGYIWDDDEDAYECEPKERIVIDYVKKENN